LPYTIIIERARGNTQMNFRDARDLAIEFGAKTPSFDHTSPVAECWIDRIAWLPRAAELGKLAEAIKEANRYSGR
jgi:hypothetical protein